MDYNVDIKQLISEIIEKEINPFVYASSSMIKELICEHLIYSYKLKASWYKLKIYIDDTPVCIIRTGKEKLQKGEGWAVYFMNVKWLI